MGSVKVDTCILCREGSLIQVLDMGDLPLPNRLPNLEDPPDELYPLDVCYCNKCGLVQLGHVVPPGEMFDFYTYVPSTSEFLTHHFRLTAEHLVKKLELRPGNFAVDIGGNDGLLLSFFQDDWGLRGLNVDPASNLVEAGRRRGVSTSPNYFTEALAGNIHSVYGPAKLITATNCLAHTAELSDYLLGVEELLDDDGAFVVEAPYLLSLIRDLRYDTIYHEHQSYFSVAPLYTQLPKYGLRLDTVEYLPDVHGGSMRYWISKQRRFPPIEGNISRWIESTEMSQSVQRTRLHHFAQDVEAKRDQVFEKIKSLDGRVAGIGASAKAAVTLNYCGLTSADVLAVADANILKQGKAIPGVRIPIVPEADLSEYDYVVDFIWNLRSDVEAKLVRLAPNAKVVEL